MQNKAYEEALAMIKSGDMLQGQRMLWDYLQTDPKNENGWMWLAQTLPGDAQRLKIMLECLKHNPDSQLARETADKLRARLQIAVGHQEKPVAAAVTPSPSVITTMAARAQTQTPTPPAEQEEILTPFMSQPTAPPLEEEPVEDIPFKPAAPPEPVTPVDETGMPSEPEVNSEGEPIPSEIEPEEVIAELKPHYRLSGWVWMAIIVLVLFLGAVGFVFVSYYVPVLYPSPTPTIDLLALAASQTIPPTDTPEPTITPIPTTTSSATPTALPTRTSTPVQFEPVIQPVLLSAPNEFGAPGKLFQFVEFNGTLYAPEDNNISRYDPAGKKMIAVLKNPAEFVPAWLTSANSRLFYFRVKFSPDGVDQDSLWVSDGTQDGTSEVLDSLQIEQQQPRPVAVGDNIYFLASQKGAPATLWYSDGTAEGTRAIAPTGVVTTPKVGSIRDLTPLGDLLYFTAFGSSGQRLWVTDGTQEGTIQFDAPTGASMATISSLAVYGESIYLSVIDQENTPVLVKVDTSSLEVVDSFAGQGSPLDITSLTVSSVKLYLKVARANQTELWVTDGTPTGGTLLHTFPPEKYTGQAPSVMVDAGGILYCVVTDATGSSSLWRSDGTPESTRLVYAYAGQDTIINPVDVSSLAPQPVLSSIGETVYFLVQSAGRNNITLWQSDDGGQGVVKIMDGSHNQVIPADLHRAAAGTLIFTDIDTSTYLYQP